MELVLTEIACLILICSIYAVLKSSELNGVRSTGFSLNTAFISFILYLIAAIIVHIRTEGIFTYSLTTLQYVMVFQLTALMTFIFIWFWGMESRFVNAEQTKILATTQILLIALFVILALTELSRNRLFVFTVAGKPIGGTGLPMALSVSAILVLIGAVVLFFYRKIFTGFTKVGMILSLLTLAVALVFFYLFRHPYLLSIVGTFILVFSYLAWQRRELTLDQLTKIPNYSAFLNRLRHIVENRRHKTIMVLDIENFRLINDRYSTAVGDTVLQTFAANLSSFGSHSLAYRLFGNRFAMIFPKLNHNSIVREVNKMRHFASAGYEIAESLITFHLNIAIVETPLGTNTREEIIESLEFTMAEIKERRRMPVIIFNQRLIPIRQRRLEVLSLLRRTLYDDTPVIVHYQPIIDASDNRIVAAEALMRLYDERMGIVWPGEFIPAAEQAGLITRLTEVMVRKVCNFLCAHTHLAENLGHISINISADDLASTEIALRLLTVILDSKVDPNKLVFEVTESMLLGNREQIKKNWDLFAQHGIRFMLDDFGTGYSNLETLVTLPFEIIKIDRSVVSNPTNNYQLLSLIASMLKRLDKQFVAEGIETKEQLAIATAQGVHYIQGYLFSKPVEEEQLVEWMSGSMCIVPIEE